MAPPGARIRPRLAGRRRPAPPTRATNREGPVAHDERVACTVCGQRNHRDTLVCPACGARRAGAEDLRRQAFQVFWPLTLGAG